jgi:hypothetical protein
VKFLGSCRKGRYVGSRRFGRHGREVEAAHADREGGPEEAVGVAWATAVNGRHLEDVLQGVADYAVRLLESGDGLVRREAT